MGHVVEWKVFDTRKTNQRVIQKFLDKNTIDEHYEKNGEIHSRTPYECRVHVAKPYVIVEVRTAWTV